MKKAEFYILPNLQSKKTYQNSQETFLSLKIKLTVVLLTIFTYFRKIDKILSKNSGKRE